MLVLREFSVKGKPGVVMWRLMVFLVEYLATQTGGATVNNIFEVILVEYLATI